MTLALDSLTMEKIQTRQAEIRPIRTLLMLLAGLFFGIGWALFHGWALVWSAFSWSLAACVEGWSAAKEARAPGAG